MNASVYTIHQAKYVNDCLSEVVILCRDIPEPESPIFFFEETVFTVKKVIECMLRGDLIYAQWGENSVNIEIVQLENGEESIEVVPNHSGKAFDSLAKLPRFH